MSDVTSIGLQTWIRAEETQGLFDALADADGSSNNLRFVGGCIRNALLGAEVNDIDLATTLVPDEVVRRLEAAGLKAVPTGIDHGTITAISGGKPYEITTLRKDVETHGRHATIAYSTDWAEDAARRDFTMNALYADRAGEIFDPLGGLDDLKAKRVRFIGDAATRIAEDYLRILRFFRIHAWYGAGDLDADGLKACAEATDGLTSLSAERVRNELLKLVCAAEPIPVMRQMAATGILAVVLPERLAIDRLQKLAHTDMISLFKPDAILRLGALVEGGPDEADALGKRLRLSNAETARLRAMKTETHRIFSYMSVREMRQCLYRTGLEAFQDRLRIYWAEDPKENNGVGWRALMAMAATWERPELPLTGENVMAAGVPSGPEIGRILGEVEDWWVESDFIDDEFSLIERLKAIVQATVF